MKPVSSTSSEARGKARRFCEQVDAWERLAAEALSPGSGTLEEMLKTVTRRMVGSPVRAVALLRDFERRIKSLGDERSLFYSISSYRSRRSARALLSMTDIAVHPLELALGIERDGLLTRLAHVDIGRSLSSVRSNRPNSFVSRHAIERCFERTSWSERDLIGMGRIAAYAAAFLDKEDANDRELRLAWEDGVLIGRIRLGRARGTNEVLRFFDGRTALNARDLLPSQLAAARAATQAVLGLFDGSLQLNDFSDRIETRAPQNPDFIDQLIAETPSESEGA